MQTFKRILVAGLVVAIADFISWQKLGYYALALHNPMVEIGFAFLPLALYVLIAARLPVTKNAGNFVLITSITLLVIVLAGHIGFTTAFAYIYWLNYPEDILYFREYSEFYRTLGEFQVKTFINSIAFNLAAGIRFIFIRKKIRASADGNSTNDATINNQL